MTEVTESTDAVAEARDQEGAKTLYRQAAETGGSVAVLLRPHGLDPDGSPIPPWRQDGPAK